MIVVADSSAIVAIFQQEPEARRLLAVLSRGERLLISAANYVETGAVLAGRSPADDRWRGVRDLDGFLAMYAFEIVPVTPEQARLALQARIAFGRGFGSGARLNFGDCFAYALAKKEGAKLLYVGNDFAATDVEAAI